MATKHAAISKWQQNLLPSIVDHLAENVPDSVYAEFPRSTTTYAEGFRQITYREFANAVNGVAHWLHNTLGPSKNFEVLAYIGVNDLRYTAVVLGAVKAGYTILLISPRNSIAAQLSLCNSTQCTKLVSPKPKPSAAINLLEQSDLGDLTIPDLETLIDVEHPHYPYPKTYEQARNDPLLIIHTSGSTGIPKPLVYRHETAARNFEMLSTSPSDGYTSQDRMFQGKRVVSMMPPFHGAGLASFLFNAIPFGTVYISPLPSVIPSAHEVTEILRHTTADATLVVPSIVLEFAQSKNLLDFAAEHLDLILYCGGDLPQAIGDIVTQKILLRCQYGASEIGLTPQLLPTPYDRNDWKYVCFPSCMGFEFQPAADGLSELVVKRDSALQSTQPSFMIFPDQDEYRSRDLFRPHPKHPYLWAWTARADDIIVFLNGEKTNPISFEQHIVAQNEEVSAAIIVGSQRFQASLLAECTEDLVTIADEAAFIERIWPSVEEANQMTPAHARIEKAMILPLDRRHPTIRAGKGTIQRAATLQLFAKEIEQLYQNVDFVSESDPDDSKQLDKLDSIESMSKYIQSVLPHYSSAESQNFFSDGMDSLAALGLIRKLRNQLRMPTISLSMIYSNPSVGKLAEAIISLRRGEAEMASSAAEKRMSEIKTTLAEFKDRIERLPKPGTKVDQSQKKVVVLTGSTGTVGSFVLRSLMNDPSVAHVYCLNRRKDARNVQLNRLKSMGVEELIDDSRVSFYHADFTHPRLGLDVESYDLILGMVTGIIHNAWPVNFNLSLGSFRPQFEGIINLISLASNASHLTFLLFISSISTVLGRRTSENRVTEKLYADPSSLIENGYAESKWISEMLCEHAARELGTHVGIARVGQVAGPVTVPGIWNPVEWLPSLIRSSMELNILPNSLGLSMDDVHWLPVDLLAETIADIILERTISASQPDHPSLTGNSAMFFHLQNPRCTNWTVLVPGVVTSAKVATGRQMQVVPCQDWLSALRETMDKIMSSKANDVKAQFSAMETLVKRIPAVKLLDFYSNSMSEEHSTDELDMTNALSRSTTLQYVQATSDAWMRKWVGEWTSYA